MNALVDPAGSRSGLLLEKLMAAVRPEFRMPIYVPAPGDPALGGAECAVGGCDRMASTQRGLCNHTPFGGASGADPSWPSSSPIQGPVVRGRNRLPQCTVPGCGHAVAGKGLCSRHHDRWARAGRPDIGSWIVGAASVGTSRTECRMPFCALWIEDATKVFCKNHDYRWRTAGCPDPDEYAADCRRIGTAHIDLRGISPQLALKFQYALQCRHDHRSRTTPPQAVRDAIRQVQQAGVDSLLDHTEQQWRQAARSRLRQPGLFIIDARDAVETLRDGTGWEAEYPRDVWRLHKLPGITTGHGQSSRWATS